MNGASQRPVNQGTDVCLQKNPHMQPATHDILTLQHQLDANGYAVTQPILTDVTIEALLACIERADQHHAAFRKTDDLFAIRQFFKQVPGALTALFDEALISFVDALLGKEYRMVKCIYFDKPAASNWFVAYHQDLTIAVAARKDVAGFGPWTVKQEQYAVQPPLPVLEDMVTLRIHLDETNAGNGALKVIPASHRKGIYRPETIDWDKEQEDICNVPKGGIMLMKPLLLHASGRTTNNRPRRVVHIEFSSMQLPDGLEWAEEQRW